jgi:hypothetical protein
VQRESRPPGLASPPRRPKAGNPDETRPLLWRLATWLPVDVRGPVQTDRETATNWSQVRDRIDRGETGDKKAVPDPATAPLGTDAEAGGTPTGSEHVARSLAAERAGSAERAAAQGREVARPGRTLALLGLAAIAVVAVVLAVALLLAA